MKEIINVINKSSRLRILAGHPVTLYREKFIFFIEMFPFPVLLTWRAIDLLPDDHPQNAGRPGMIGHPEANRTLQECDCLIVLGARIDDALTSFNIDGFAPNAVKIVVDIDQAELDRLPADYYRVNQDVGEFMDELLEAVE